MTEIARVRSVQGRLVALTDEEHAAHQARSDANEIELAERANNETLTEEIDNELKAIMPGVLDYIANLTDSPQEIKDANANVVSKSAQRT